MRKIKFISYSGKYPNLCSGELTFRIDDAEYNVKYGMISGGKCFIDFDEKSEIVESGQWKLAEERFQSFMNSDEIAELERQVNIEVPHGCCGGCL